MRIRLGINTCFAVKRWPRPIDWATVVRDDLGLELVELSLDLLPDIDIAHLRRRAVAETRAALAATGLTAVGTFTGLVAYSRNLLLHPDLEARRDALRWYETVVDVSAELGLAGTGGHVGAYSVLDWQDRRVRAERWAGLKVDLATLARYARRSGLEYLLIENLVPEREPASMAQVADLLTAGDDEHVPIRFCLDLGHECVPGAQGSELDPYAWLARFGAELAEVQLQQSDAADDHHWTFTAEHNRLGRIEAGRVLDTLMASGASDVILMLEVIPSWQQPDDELRAELAASVDYWRRAIIGRGLTA
ncbi:MAG: sugar phosphate isomerase/epimerase family protein [Candidatus Limnocylindrales bacterium]